MATSLPQAELATFYPSSDGEPLAESYDHLCVIVKIWEEGEVPSVIFEVTLKVARFGHRSGG
jgi:hypothetical protein